MARPKSEKRACVYVADTECTTTVDWEEDDYVFAYLMNMQSIRTAEITGSNATSLPEKLTFSGPDTLAQWTDEFLEKIPQNAALWFYNTRYDCAFIEYYLMNERGYVSFTWDEKEENKERNRRAREAHWKEHPEDRGTIRIDYSTGDVVVTKGKAPVQIDTKVIRPIRSGSRLISLEITNSQGHKLRIMDVGSKWTNLPDWDKTENRPITGVEAIAHMFGGRKTSLDVLKYRGPGYVPDEEEIIRCETDTHWIRLAMEKMYAMGLTSSTLAGDAWKIYSAIRAIGIKGVEGDKTGKKKELLDRLSLEIEYGSLPEDGILEDLKENGWTFEDGTEIDIRDAYKGGVTYVKPEIAGMDIVARKGARVAHDDCNSMHPKSMICSMPYGTPWRTVNKPEGEFYIMKAMVSFKLKQGRFPTISNKTSQLDSAEWMTEGCMDVTMTSYDWDWAVKNYDIEFIGDKYYLNWHTRVNEAACIYVNHFTEEKKKWKARMKDKGLDETERMEASIMYYVAKILMNALYGKFGQNPEKPYEWCTIEDGAPTYRKSNVKKGEFEDSEFHKYLPFACAVTGCSRDRLWEHIDMIGYENYLYGDTDSAFFITPAETQEELVAWLKGKGVDVDPVKLGAWDIEHGLEEGEEITVAKFVRAKVYGLIQANGEITVKTAGLPIAARKSMKTLDDMYIGRVFEKARLIPHPVRGGMVLLEKDFTLKEH